MSLIHDPPTTLPPAAEALSGVWDEAALQSAAAAATGDDTGSVWTFALAQHNLAVLGRRGAAAAAEAKLKTLLVREPDHPLALAYLGNAVIMVARDSRNVMTKAGVVKRGLEFLDQAVDRAPDDIVVRLLRAGSGRRLPKLFNRKAIAKADLARAIELLERESPQRSETLAETLFELAILYAEKDELEQRRHLLMRANSISPTSEWGIKAAAALV